MAGETLNYKLKKPDPDDFYNINDFNSNADKIDLALTAHAAALSDKADKDDLINVKIGDIDCGSWEETPVTLHNASTTAHVNLNVDGNANGAVTDELAAHETDPDAHPNIILDGNNN